MSTQSKVQKYLVAIAGPTAAGKTNISIEVARRYGTVIVSADSRQIYREMTIGTAKPTPEQLNVVPHYFVDHLEITEEYSAGRYEKDCLHLLEKLFEDHDVIFLVGGSGLYLRAVLEGFDAIPVIPGEYRQKWEQVYSDDGIEALRKAIDTHDPQYAKQVDLQNPQRLIRALSVYDATGRKYSAYRRQKRAQRPFRTVKIVCSLPRPLLYARINQRVEEMLTDGLVDEVKRLIPYRNAPALRTVGYRELFAHFDGEYSLKEAVEKIKQHTRNYAKRQLTWFGHQGDWKEFSPPDVESIHAYIRKKTGT